MSSFPSHPSRHRRHGIAAMALLLGALGTLATGPAAQAADGRRDGHRGVGDHHVSGDGQPDAHGGEDHRACGAVHRMGWHDAPIVGPRPAGSWPPRPEALGGEVLTS